MADAFWDPMHIVNPPFQACETTDLPANTVGQVHDPRNANPLMHGEWVDISNKKIARAAATAPMPVLYVGEVGRTDIQVTKKGPVLLTRPNRIKTKLVDGSSSLVVGDEVMVGDVTINSLSKKGLIKATGSGNYAQGKVLAAGTNTGAPDGSYWEILLYNQPRIIA